MNRALLVLSALGLITNAAVAADDAVSCLDISGTYELPRYTKSPCAPNERVMKVWLKCQQTACSKVTFSTVYKLTDGTFCESLKSEDNGDGAEWPSPIAGYTFKYEILADRHVLTLKEVPTGSVTVETKTLDSKGSLVIDDSEGSHEVLKKSPIQ